MARRAGQKTDAKQPRKTARKRASAPKPAPKSASKRNAKGHFLSGYDPDKAGKIVRLMADTSLSLTKACGQVGVSKGAFLGWVVDDIDGIAGRYERARKVRAWAMLDELIEIADDGTNDYVEQQTKEGVRIAFDREHVQRSKLRCDQRQWALARILRKEFGDKVQLSGDPDGAPIKTDGKITVEFVKPALAPQPTAH